MLLMLGEPNELNLQKWWFYHPKYFFVSWNFHWISIRWGPEFGGKKPGKKKNLPPSGAPLEISITEVPSSNLT
jgi:hypothetical protein